MTAPKTVTGLGEMRRTRPDSLLNVRLKILAGTRARQSHNYQAEVVITCSHEATVGYCCSSDSVE